VVKCQRERDSNVWEENTEFSVKKRVVWPSKADQIFDFLKSGNVVMGILRKTVVNVFRCDSDILQQLLGL
jgi:uncharacterized protein (DUF342 family)